MIESGWFYGVFIDPVLDRIRKEVASQVNPGKNVLDVACGTGAQVFEFAKTASTAVGIDLSKSMIDYARKIKTKERVTNAEFYVADATNLSIFEDGDFDISSLSLALHQFHPSLHDKILSEMKRVSGKIIVFDYAVPLPKNHIGYGSKVAEFFAGKSHHKNFKHYYSLGGLERILPENQLKIEHSEYFGKKAFQLVIGSPK